MQKHISIISPRYSENFKLLKSMLSSINNQVGYDLNKIELILIDDCGPEPLENIKQEIIDFCDFDVKFLKTEKNVGPGAARQVGIDNAEGEWIIQVDCDDQLLPYAFCAFSMSDYENMDWVQFPGFALGEQDQKAALAPHNSQLTWIFGIFVRKSFIRKSKVRYNDFIRSNEEQVFNHGLFARLDKNKRAQMGQLPIYLWSQLSTDTITRINGGEYARTCIPEFFVGRKLVIDDYCSIGQFNEAMVILAQSLVHGYYSSHQTILDGYDDWLENIENWIGYIYHTYKDKFEEIDKETIKNLVLEGAKSCDRQVTETFEDWLERIECECPEFYLQPYETMNKNTSTGEIEITYSKVYPSEVNMEI